MITRLGQACKSSTSRHCERRIVLRVKLLAAPLALALGIMLLGAAANSAMAQDRVRQAVARMGAYNPDQPVTITAGSQEFDNRSGVWRGSGGVIVSNESLVVYADEASIDQNSGDVMAVGNVRLVRPGMAEWQGARLAFNHRTGAGLAESNLVKVGRFTVHAAHAERTAADDFVLKEVSLTTCTNAPGHWHWHMTTGAAKYSNSKTISAKHSTVWFMGVPVAYLPYFYRDFDTHYGLRWLPGYTSDWGLFTRGRYVYPYLHAPEWLDLTGQARLDWRSKRGVAVGHDFKWDFDVLGDGGLELYYAQDRSPERLRYFPAKRARNDRTRIALRHQAELTDKDRLFIKGQDLSDSGFLREFFEAEYRKSAQPDNVASYTHREAGAAGGVTVSGPLDDFYDGVRRLPEAWLNIMPQPLLPGLYYESQSRAGYLQKQTAPRAPGILPLRGPEYATFRVDTYHRLSCPFWLGVVRLVPRAAYHGTFYRQAAVEDSGKVRNLFEAGLEASTRAYGSIAGLRHVVEPYVDYSWIPRPKDLEDGENYVFDRADSGLVWRDWFGLDGVPMWRQWHGLRFGVRNALQNLEHDRTQRTVLESDVYGAYTFGTAGEPEGVRIIGTTLSASPHKNVRLRMATEYDPKDNEVRTADNRITLTYPKWELNLGHFYSRDIILDSFGIWSREPSAHLVYGGGAYTFNSVWSAGLHARYECRQSRLQEVMGFVEYRLDCMALQLRAGYEPKYTDINGREERANFKIGFAISIRGMENKFGMSKDSDEFQF